MPGITPPAGCDGNLGRNRFTRPGFFQIDLRVVEADSPRRTPQTRPHRGRFQLLNRTNVAAVNQLCDPAVAPTAWPANQRQRMTLRLVPVRLEIELVSLGFQPTRIAASLRKGGPFVFPGLAEILHPRKVELPFPVFSGRTEPHVSNSYRRPAIVAGAGGLGGSCRAFGSQKKSEAIESQMSELRRDLQSVATAQAQAAGQITTLASTVTQRDWTRYTKSLTDGVAQSADISAKGQTAMRDELKSTQGMMERIYKQLGEFQEVSRGLSSAQQSLESVLGGAKTRGILGEVTSGTST